MIEVVKAHVYRVKCRPRGLPHIRKTGVDDEGAGWGQEALLTDCLTVPLREWIVSRVRNVGESELGAVEWRDVAEERHQPIELDEDVDRCELALRRALDPWPARAAA